MYVDFFVGGRPGERVEDIGGGEGEGNEGGEEEEKEQGWFAVGSSGVHLSFHNEDGEKMEESLLNELFYFLNENIRNYY